MNAIETNHLEMVRRLLKPGETIKAEIKQREFEAIILAQHMASEAAAIMDNLIECPDYLDEMSGEDWHEQHMAIGMVGEAGEILDVIKKLYIYRKVDGFDSYAQCLSNLDLELGDLAFFITGFELTNTMRLTTKLLRDAQTLAKMFGLDWNMVLQRNIDKLTHPEKGRYKDGTYSDAQAQNRNDETAIRSS